MPLSRRRVTDSAALKALAHPVRLALLEALVVEGPKTATQAAELVADTPSNCSWHLRKLAEHGFVREVAGSSGRGRPWRAVSEALTWGGEEDAASTAGAGLADMLLERELQRFRAARASRDSEPSEWREATALNQSVLWLTAEEANRVCTRLVELSRISAERLRHPEQRPEGARLMSLVSWLVPHGPLSAPDSPGTTRPDPDKAGPLRVFVTEPRGPADPP